jgi:hypothetical protein
MSMDETVLCSQSTGGRCVPIGAVEVDRKRANIIFFDCGSITAEE